MYKNATVLPDLDITVDFTALNAIVTSTWPTFAQISVPISIGLTNSHGTTSIEDIFARSPPVSLIPGMSIVAPYKLRVRQIFTNRALAALGFFQVREYVSQFCIVPFDQSIYACRKRERSMNQRSKASILIQPWRTIFEGQILPLCACTLCRTGLIQGSLLTRE